MNDTCFQAAVKEHAEAGQLVELADRASGLSLAAAVDRGFILAGIELYHPGHGPVQLLHNGNRFPEGFDSGMSPILFPVVGRSRIGDREGVYKLGGREYRIDIHGFAKDLPWELVEVGADDESAYATARLVDNETTRESYPFGFVFEMTYGIEGGAIVFDATIDCEGPYCLGFHPYFKSPVLPAAGPKSDGILKVPASRLWEDENLVPTGRKLPIPEKWPLAAGMPLGDEIDVAFSDMNADDTGTYRCELTDPASRYQLTVEADNRTYPEVVIYTPATDPFVCIENWTAPPNALNTGWGLIGPLTRLSSTLRFIPRWTE